MIIKTLLASALLCLPATAEAARLTSAPLTLDPLNGDPPHVTIEKVSCSIHYSGMVPVVGAVRVFASKVGVVLSRADRNFTFTTTVIGDAPTAEVVCDFDFPTVTDATLFRALVCIRGERDTACAPVY